MNDQYEWHTVEPGESWNGIAQRYGITPDDLWELQHEPRHNSPTRIQLREKRGRRLFVDEQLLVPGQG